MESPIDVYVNIGRKAVLVIVYVDLYWPFILYIAPVSAFLAVRSLEPWHGS